MLLSGKNFVQVRGGTLFWQKQAEKYNTDPSSGFFLLNYVYTRIKFFELSWRTDFISPCSSKYPHITLIMQKIQIQGWRGIPSSLLFSLHDTGREKILSICCGTCSNSSPTLQLTTPAFNNYSLICHSCSVYWLFSLYHLFSALNISNSNIMHVCSNILTVEEKNFEIKFNRFMYCPKKFH